MKTIIALILAWATSAQGGLFFDGSAAYAGRPSDVLVEPFAPRNAVTISMWIRRSVTNYAGLDSSNLHNLGAGPGHHALSINNTATNRLEFTYAFDSDSSQQIYATAGNAASITNQWLHIVWVYTYGVAGSAVYYVNGVPQIGSWVTGTGGGAPSQNHQPRIGTDNYSHYLAGEITEYAILAEEALTYREVTILGSRLKRIAWQLRGNQQNHLAGGGYGTSAYFPMDNYPGGVAASTTGTNNVKDISSYHSPLSTVGTPVWTVERVCSYPPNE